MKRSEMTLAQKLEADRKPKPLHKYTFHVLTNPPMFEILAGIAQVERKTVTVEGFSRADTMRKAGIQ